MSHSQSAVRCGGCPPPGEGSIGDGSPAREREALVRELLSACRRRDYAGYSKFDALNSPALEALSFNNRYLRLLFTQLVKECPWHVRPWLGVRKGRNPKGIALFARAYLNLFERTGDEETLREARTLLDWLIIHRSTGSTKYAWGYNFIWQSQIFHVDRYQPNAVVTVFVAEAMLHAFRVTGEARYFDVARSAGAFLLTELPVLFEDDEERAISYVKERAARIVLNTQVLTGAVFVKLFKIDGDERWLATARKQYAFTVNRRIKDCTWSYSYPAERYHNVDNYHTGGVLDALLEFYEETGDDRHLALYWRGMEYYRDHLFEGDGAPRWMDNQPFPYDIHGAAQGIISFVKAAKHRPEWMAHAERVTDWTVANMFNRERTEFIYRIGRYMRWDYSFMRWCNAWMSKAMSDLVVGIVGSGSLDAPGEVSEL